MENALGVWQLLLIPIMVRAGLKGICFAQVIKRPGGGSRIARLFSEILQASLKPKMSIFG
jgi:hypothetical protein